MRKHTKRVRDVKNIVSVSHTLGALLSCINHSGYREFNDIFFFRQIY